MELARILTDIATYISCIQPADIDKAQLPSNTYFTQLIEYLNRIHAMVQQLPPEQKRQLQPEFNQFLGDVKAELARLAANKETVIKPLYARELNECIRLLTF